MKTKKLHKLMEDRITTNNDEWYLAEDSEFFKVGKAGMGCVYAFLTFFIAIIAIILILIF